MAAAPRDARARRDLLEMLGAGHRDESLTLASELVGLEPSVPGHALRLAALHLDARDVPSALAVLDAARRRTPQVWILRQQYWALEHPERFYAGPIDTAWTAAQRKRERDVFERPRRR